MKKVYISEERFLDFLEEPRKIREIMEEFNLKSYGAIGSRLRRLQDRGKVLVTPNTSGKGFKYKTRQNKKEVDKVAENLEAAIEQAPTDQLTEIINKIISSVEELNQFMKEEGVAQEKLRQLESIIKE